MFGVHIIEHETRYDYAAPQEWIDVFKLLWAREDEFDYGGGSPDPQGLPSAQAHPETLPALMNADGWPTGLRFAAPNADMAFVELLSHDYEGVKDQVDRFRFMAQENFNRRLDPCANTYVVCLPTQK